jgi:NTE family protein
LVEAVFDDTPRRSALIFAVHMWGPNGPEPDTIWTVMSRQKDLQYANPAVSHIRRQKQIHELRHIIAELAQKLPAEMRAEPDIAAMADLGRITRMHVVRLLAPPLAGEDDWKDIDFSSHGIYARWEAGDTDTKRVLAEMPGTRNPAGLRVSSPTKRKPAVSWQAMTFAVVSALKGLDRAVPTIFTASVSSTACNMEVA